MDNYNQDATELFALEVDETAKSTFLEMARWTKFLSILGFIFLGLMVIGGIIMVVVADSLPGSSPFAFFGPVGTMVYFLFIAGIIFYPIYALLRFSTQIKSGINAHDKFQFNKAIKSLKNTFKYYGILMIIMLGIYGIAIVAIGISAATK